VIRALTVAVALCGSAVAIAQTSITDATGRAITLPQRVERVYVAGPPAAVLLLAVAPQKLIGWTRAPRPDEAAYLPDAVALLPALGRLTGRGNTANVEVVMSAKPDLIVDVGSTSATFVSLAQRVEQQTGIPYLLFDGSLRDTPRLLREIGKAVGATEAAESLARDAKASCTTSRCALRVSTFATVRGSISHAVRTDSRRHRVDRCRRRRSALREKSM
jgi:iron complex transport system substrate-binding protein